VGAFAGAAMGVGGMYLYNKQQAKKRTTGWSGQWTVSYDGEEISEVNVVDDQAGGLTIAGFPGCEDPLPGSYTVSEETGYTIQFVDPTAQQIDGVVEDEHAITWVPWGTSSIRNSLTRPPRRITVIILSSWTGPTLCSTPTSNDR